MVADQVAGAHHLRHVMDGAADEHARLGRVKAQQLDQQRVDDHGQGRQGRHTDHRQQSEFFVFLGLRQHGGNGQRGRRAADGDGTARQNPFRDGPLEPLGQQIAEAQSRHQAADDDQ
ncbi:hypothetical protein D3C81_1709870 [compost metagenome]